MTYEKALNALNEDLEKARADNDLTKFYDIKIAKHVLLKEMGEEVAKEYIELFGK
jgi:predicted outer membrane protein|tara:strand:- start:237 stop:401 length:165 start_codon:yes stop_codon:yes gene_type:complete